MYRKTLTYKRSNRELTEGSFSENKSSLGILVFSVYWHGIRAGSESLSVLIFFFLLLKVSLWLSALSVQVVCLCSDLSTVSLLFLVWFSLFTVSDVLGLALILGSFILIPGLFIFRQSLFWFLVWNYLALSVEFLLCNLWVGYFSFGFIMSSDRLDSFHIRFNGKNYSAWEFQFQLFVKGKELWGHIDGSNPAPKDVDALSKWEIMDARVMSWILSSIEPHLVLNLRP